MNSNSSNNINNVVVDHAATTGDVRVTAGGAGGVGSMDATAIDHGSGGVADEHTVTMTESGTATNLLRQCLALHWRPGLFTGVSMEALQQAREWSVGMTGLTDGALQRDVLAHFGAKMPPEAWRVCDSTGEAPDYENCSPEHFELVRAATLHVMDIAPFAHCSAVLKDRLRRIVGSSLFSPRLRAAGVFRDLVNGCNAHMRKVGATLRRLYCRLELDEHFASAPTMVRRDNVTGVLVQSAAAVVQSPTDESSSVDWVRQPVVAAAIPLFKRTLPHATPDATGHEGPFIHLLRLLALAVDTMFQKAVNAALKDAGIDLVDGKVWSGGVKGYDRMWNKAHSVDDHRFKEWPRPQFNKDVVRCLATFDEVADMRRALDVLATIFEGGGFADFKNGMAASDEEAAESHHLRLMLGVGLFVPKDRPTLGDLRSDPDVQKVWASYLMQERSGSVGRNTWKNHVSVALRWIRRELPASTPAAMFCEVQLVLRPYRDARRRMHELYKIARATTSEDLYAEFRKYAEAARAKMSSDHDGATALATACRDGLAGRVRELLPATMLGVDSSVGFALSVAASHVRPDCVDEVLRRHRQCITQSRLDDALLRICASDVPTRDGFDVLEVRNRITRRLLDAKAHPNSAREADGVGPLCMAAEYGRVQQVRLLLAAKASCNGGDFDGRMALHRAAMRGQVDVVVLLLASKADCNVQMPGNGNTVCHDAAGENHADVVTVLLRAKADIERRRADGSSPCMFAAQYGSTSVVRALLAAKAPCDEVLPSDNSPLWIRPVEQGYADVVGVLLDAKVDVHSLDAQGRTIAGVAAVRGHTAVVDVLLRAKADVDAGDVARGFSPLLMATLGGHADTVRRLLTAKANAHACFPGAGWSTLTYAAGAGHVGVVRTMVEFAPELCRMRTPTAHREWDRHFPAGSLPIEVASAMERNDVVNVLAEHL